jgi:hypothetical protein
MLLCSKYLDYLFQGIASLTQQVAALGLVIVLVRVAEPALMLLAFAIKIYYG